MSTNVAFRVVGIYCYFPRLKLQSIDPATSTVKDVMDAIQNLGLGFNYTEKHGSVDSIGYEYSQNSERPFNTGGVPSNGFRDESELFGTSEALAWQYYRSISGTFPGDPTLYEIKIANATFEQPRFGLTPLARGQQVPRDFTIVNYNLTWRLLRLQLTQEAAIQRVNRVSGRMR